MTFKRNENNAINDCLNSITWRERLKGTICAIAEIIAFELFMVVRFSLFEMLRILGKAFRFITFNRKFCDMCAVHVTVSYLDYKRYIDFKDSDELLGILWFGGSGIKYRYLAYKTLKMRGVKI